MLDLVVLIAMAVTAVALAMGLIVQAGIPQVTAIIAAAALYLVMAASYLVVARPSRAGDTDRLDQLEGALEVIELRSAAHRPRRERCRPPRPSLSRCAGRTCAH